jgi:CRISPR-associated protein Csd1
MILQALNRYYDILLKDQSVNIPRLGYSTVGVSFALNISAEGELLDVLPLYDQEQRGKKTVEVPRSIVVPAQVKRASNVTANFLWDNPTYVLGISDQDEAKPRYSRERFEAFRQLNSDLLAGVDNPAARALLAFLQHHDPFTARGQRAIASNLDALRKGGNLVFLFKGAFVHDDPAIRQAWSDHLAGQGAEKMQCLVTGKVAPVARLHPGLKRVRGAQPTGATLVGFNAAAYESYNRSQGQISPVSEEATFAYTTVLNYLLSDANPNKKLFLGDTTVVYWAESENRAYEPAFAGIIDPAYVEEAVTEQAERKKAEAELGAVAQKVKRAQALNLDAMLAGLGDENPRFYILGLAPNAARVSVRFFISDAFKKIVANIMAHYRDMEIDREYDNQSRYLPLWRILDETVSKKAKDRAASPLLAGAVMRAILTGAPYPAALYNALIIRIRADMDETEKRISKINYVRAAVIKAYLLRKYRHQPDHLFKEVLIVSLNKQSTIPAYRLGRLFAVLEKAQREAVPGLNASIADRYFTSACAAPASVFPTLLRLSRHHIAKLKYGYVYDQLTEEILQPLDVENNRIPARLTLEEQGVFVLGYYHQRRELWTAKSKNEDEPKANGNEL